MNNYFEIAKEVLSCVELKVVLGVCVIGAAMIACNSESDEDYEYTENIAYGDSTQNNNMEYFSLLDNNDSFCFSSEYVMEAYEFDGEYYIVYDDADAGFYNEVLRVDVETFKSICATKVSQTGQMVGYLFLNDKYADATYTYIHEEQI